MRGTPKNAVHFLGTPTRPYKQKEQKKNTRCRAGNAGLHAALNRCVPHGSPLMAPRAYWKGYLKLSLVSCPIALFPATSEREKISFHQLNKKTGNRIKYRKVDAETGDEVESDSIIKGYEVGKSQYLELDPEELEAIAIESKRLIEIDEFVPKQEIDELYLNNPYYIVPDGEVGQQAFAGSAEVSLKRKRWQDRSNQSNTH